MNKENLNFSKHDNICNDNFILAFSKYYIVEILMVVFFILGYFIHQKYFKNCKSKIIINNMNDINNENLDNNNKIMELENVIDQHNLQN